MKRLLLISALALMAGCDDKNESKLRELEIAGHVVSSVFQDGSVYAYTWSESGNVFLGQAQMGQNSTFTLKVTPPVGSSVLMIKYRDGKLGNLRMAGDEYLVSLVPVTSAGETVTTSLSALSTLIADLAKQDRDRYFKTESRALSDALEAFSAWLGFNVRSFEDAPPGQGELLERALIELADTYSVSPQIPYFALLRLMRRDVSDGHLDAREVNQTLCLGGVCPGANLYRLHWPTAFLQAAVAHTDSPEKLAEYAAYAEAWSHRSTSLVTSAGGRLDVGEPVLVELSIQDGQLLSGEVTIEAEFFDLIGVQESALYLNDDQIALSDNGLISATVNTQLFADGQHKLAARALGLIGTEVTETITFRVANAAPEIVIENPQPNAWVRGITTYQAFVADAAGIANTGFTFSHGLQVTPESGTAPVYTLDTSQLLDGPHEFTVSTTNSAGIETERSVSYLVDNTPPWLAWSLDQVSYVMGDLDIQLMATDNLALVGSRLLLNGDELEAMEPGSTQTVNLDTTTLVDGTYTFRFEAADAAGNTSALTRLVTIDNTPVNVVVNNPMEGDVITSSFNIMAAIDLDDSVSGVSEPVVILVDGEEWGLASPHQSMFYRLNINSFPNGPHTISVRVKNRAGNVTQKDVNVIFDCQATPPDWC
ncbi:MAG: hypothetical protein LAT63_16590 [Marinobacter sp.]|nr:hypothetical protein [Marinobacter sp.]